MTFLAIGGGCLVVQMCILAFLIRLGTTEPVANAIGFAASAQLNYLLSRRLTWGDRLATMGTMVGYHALALVSLLVNTVVFVGTYRGLGVAIAAVLAAATSAVLNYALCNLVVFGRRAGLPAEVTE